MSGIRIGATQPVSARAVLTLAETTWAGVTKLQNWSEGVILAAGPVLAQQLPNVLVALLAPAAGVALVMGIWRFCADTGWTDTFLITGGFFSHWQVWIALSIALKLLSSFLLAWAGRTAKIRADD